MTRRTVLRHAAVGSTALALGGSLPGWARKRARPFSDGRFASGVSAGFPRRHSAHLWTRLDGAEHHGTLGWEVARDPDFRNVIDAGHVRVGTETDFTAKPLVANRKLLKPGERYHYRFFTTDRSSAVGRFQTLRPPDSAEPLRVGFFSCQGWQPGYYTAHAGLAQEELDLVVSIGDYIYERTDDDGPRVDTIGPDDSAQTLGEYRRKYHLYQSDRDLQAMHAAHTFLCVWDDHELESGWKAQYEGETQGRERRVTYEQRIHNGRKAFFEHLPIPVMKRDHRRIYRRIRLGRHADLFLLDLHSYGSDFQCGFHIPPQPCPQADDPSLTMLGPEQKAWLKAGLARSSATWKVLGNSLMMMSLDLYPGQAFNYGQWDGFVAERRELMEHILANEIGGVTVVSGDIHTFFAGSVTTTGRSDGQRAATEFVGGSITSEGIAQGVSEALGLPEDAPETGLVTQRLKETNPHYSFVDTVNRGYAVLELGPDEMKVDLRGPTSVLEPTSPMNTWASFRVVPDLPVAERV
jgi:alkaline phosphatase D